MSTSPFSQLIVRHTGGFTGDGLAKAYEQWVLLSEAEADKQAALAKAAEVVSPEVQNLRNELNEARHKIYVQACQIDHWSRKSKDQVDERVHLESELIEVRAQLKALKKKKPTKKKARK